MNGVDRSGAKIKKSPSPTLSNMKKEKEKPVKSCKLRKLFRQLTTDINNPLSFIEGFRSLRDTQAVY
jgi:hypothetical protein